MQNAARAGNPSVMPNLQCKSCPLTPTDGPKWNKIVPIKMQFGGPAKEKVRPWMGFQTRCRRINRFLQRGPNGGPADGLGVRFQRHQGILFLHRNQYRVRRGDQYGTRRRRKFHTFHSLPSRAIPGCVANPRHGMANVDPIQSCPAIPSALVH